MDSSRSKKRLELPCQLLLLWHYSYYSKLLSWYDLGTPFSINLSIFAYILQIPSRHTTSYRRLIDIETMSCVYWIEAKFMVTWGQTILVQFGKKIIFFVFEYVSDSRGFLKSLWKFGNHPKTSGVRDFWRKPRKFSQDISEHL